MAKWANDLMMDASLDYVAGSVRMVACSAQPANYAGIAAVALADVTLAGGDFTKANGDVRPLCTADSEFVVLPETTTAE